MGIPTMIVGPNHKIIHKTRAPVIVLPFKTDLGSFFVEVSINKDKS
jgi:chemotaxis protein CheX